MNFKLKGDGAMSRIDLYKRANNRDAEFKGRCAVTEKYFYKHSFKSHVITIGIVILLILGVIHLIIR